MRFILEKEQGPLGFIEYNIPSGLTMRNDNCTGQTEQVRAEMSQTQPYLRLRYRKTRIIDAVKT